MTCDQIYVVAKILPLQVWVITGLIFMDTKNHTIISLYNCVTQSYGG